MLLGGCGARDEIDAETAAILKDVPLGTPFGELPGAMQRLGFSCTAGQWQYPGAKGNMLRAEVHLTCDREERYWLACRKRTRVIVLQNHGRLANLLLNIDRGCG